MAFETEWVLDAGAGDEFVAATTGSAYGMSRLIDLSDYARDLLDAFDAEGIDVEQLHPEYAPSQLEVSVAPLEPLRSADRVVLVRQTIRAVSAAHGYRASLSPAFTPGGVGSGAHVHLSVWRDGRNLHARGNGPADPEGEAWLAGILDAMPALAGRRGAEHGQLPPPAAAALVRAVAVLGPGEPRGRASSSSTDRPRREDRAPTPRSRSSTPAPTPTSSSAP